jgi:formamidopyrimidine-DNA glycosylase
MPELPEVETVRTGLSRLLPGKVVAKVDSNWPKSFQSDPALIKQFLIGTKVVTIKRRAKVLIVSLDSQYSLIIHLKMTGQLVYRGEQEQFGAGHPSSSLSGKLPDRSTRVIFSFADDSKLFFNDQRKFGWIRLLPTAEIANIDFMKKYGPEPLEGDFTWRILRAQLQRRPRTSIKAALLDQSVLAGIGNIYADESLWSAKIHPSSIVKSLSDVQIKRLYSALVNVLNLALAKGGSTDRNYVDVEGRRGNYLSFANVFRRQGQPCPRCGRTIIKIRVAGRGTHLCPYCQKT